MRKGRAFCTKHHRRNKSPPAAAARRALQALTRRKSIAVVSAATVGVGSKIGAAGVLEDRAATSGERTGGGGVSGSVIRETHLQAEGSARQAGCGGRPSRSADGRSARTSRSPPAQASAAWPLPARARLRAPGPVACARARRDGAVPCGAGGCVPTHLDAGREGDGGGGGQRWAWVCLPGRGHQRHVA